MSWYDVILGRIVLNPSLSGLIGESSATPNAPKLNDAGAPLPCSSSRHDDAATANMPETLHD